jgi:hypothetical protein
LEIGALQEMVAYEMPRNDQLLFLYKNLAEMRV